jgi:hypothetical protein
MVLKKILLALFTCGTVCLTAQNKSEFNQAEATVWLNNKMLDASRYTPASDEMQVQKPNLNNCHFSLIIEIQDYGKLTQTNTFEVDLKNLSPNSLKLIGFKSRFYYEVSTTNSELKVTGYQQNITDTKKVERNSSVITFGPFETGNNLEDRVKNVIIKLITKCGGKKDTY